MARTFRHALLFLTYTVFVAQSALAQKTDTQFDKTYDFAQHKRYKWRENRLMTRQNPDTNEVMNIKIVKAVNQQLAAKGFIEVQDTPDFYLYYDGGGNAQLLAGGASLAGFRSEDFSRCHPKLWRRQWSHARAKELAHGERPTPIPPGRRDFA